MGKWFMTSPRQRVANRINGLRSSGPKTDAGKQRSSENSHKHGLSVGISDSPWAQCIPEIATLLKLEGYDSAYALELATKIVDFERNVAFQREHFLKKSSELKDGESVQEIPLKYPEMIDDLRMLEDAYEEQPDRSLAKLMQKYHTFINKVQAREEKRVARETVKAINHADRYYRRAANQLIRQLKNST